MSNLKELRSRKRSVLATRKITSAMKMIAASKLKRAHSAVLAARPYASLMSELLNDLIAKDGSFKEGQELLYGRDNPKVHLFIVATSNRGLCGGFNSSIVRRTKFLIDEQKAKGRQIKIFCVGTKGREQLRREYEESIIEHIPAIDMPKFTDAAKLSRKIHDMFTGIDFDECTIVYSHFISALNQEVTQQQLIPFAAGDSFGKLKNNNHGAIRNAQTPGDASMGQSLYEYEPSKEKVLEALLPKNLTVQIFIALLENSASEQGSRMTTMDSATRNSDDMINRLDLAYNRTRQSAITKELIEIISGADAL
jgi:F-type H+-transporting ATPase subunit gamma